MNKAFLIKDGTLYPIEEIIVIENSEVIDAESAPVLRSIDEEESL